MPSLSSNARSVPASGIRRIFELSTELDDAIQLSVGESRLAVAPHILAAGSQAWLGDFTDYTPNSGISALRSAIVRKLKRDNGYAASLDQVHVTAGGAQALHMAIELTLDHGDQILIPDPGYATFAMAPRLVGAEPIPYPLTSDRHFVPAIEDLEALVTARTRALLINSPSNPLGVVFSREVITELVDFARRHDLWIISDEVYEYLTFNEAFTSVASVDNDHRVLSVYSLSKSYSLTGARVGYLVTPPGLETAFRSAQEAIVSCVNSPAQAAAVAAIEGDQTSVLRARDHYRRNVEAACALLDQRRLRHKRPEGAFYLWIDVSHASQGNVAAWAEKFLIEERVAVAPGSAFGAAGEGWVRVCIAGDANDLLTAISRLPSTPN